MNRTIICIILAVLISSKTYAQVGFKIKDQITSINKELGKVDIIKGGKTKSEYITLEIIQFNYLGIDRKSKKDELVILENELYLNSKGKDAKPRFTVKEIEGKSNKINDLKKELKIIDHKRDSLYYLYTKDYIEADNVIAFSFGTLRSRAFFDKLYDTKGKTFNAMGNAGINFGTNSGSLYSEIVCGNLGLFRASLGTMVTSSNNENPEEAKQVEAYQRLVTYGGNTVLNFEYPIAYLHSNNNQYNLISRLIAKGTVDLPAFGTNTDKWAGSLAYGIDIYADVATSNNQLRFFVNMNLNQYYGTESFKENLATDEANFNFGQLTLGIVFLENFKISFIVYTYSSESVLRNKNIVAGGQVLSGK